MSSAVWLCWDLGKTGMAMGEHAVRIAVQERNPQVAAALTLTDVELVVRY